TWRATRRSSRPSPLTRWSAGCASRAPYGDRLRRTLARWQWSWWSRGVLLHVGRVLGRAAGEGEEHFVEARLAVGEVGQLHVGGVGELAEGEGDAIRIGRTNGERHRVRVALHGHAEHRRQDASRRAELGRVVHAHV